MLTAVLFDASGVIYHRPRFGQRIGTFLAERGLPYPDFEAVRVALTAEREAAYVGRMDASTYHRAKLAAYGVTAPEDVPQGLRVLEEESNDIELCTGVLDALPALKERGVPLAIVTDTVQPLDVKVRWLIRLGLSRELFGAIVTSVEVGASKPSPTIYRAALDRLGVLPDTAAFIGHATDELDGAAAVGLTTIAFRPDDPGVVTDYRIDDMRELLGIVDP